jgi:hypothetical protein
VTVSCQQSDVQGLLAQQYVAGALSTFDCVPHNATILVVLSESLALLQAHCSSNYTSLDSATAVALYNELEAFTRGVSRCERSCSSETYSPSSPQGDRGRATSGGARFVVYSVWIALLAALLILLGS